MLPYHKHIYIYLEAFILARVFRVISILSSEWFHKNTYCPNWSINFDCSKSRFSHFLLSRCRAIKFICIKVCFQTSFRLVAIAQDVDYTQASYQWHIAKMQIRRNSCSRLILPGSRTVRVNTIINLLLLIILLFCFYYYYCCSLCFTDKPSVPSSQKVQTGRHSASS